MMKKKTPRHYSGRRSFKFWERVHAIKDKKLHDALYSLGAILQSAEYHALETLEHAEKRKRA